MRRISTAQWEGMLASLSLAGVQVLAHGSAAPAAGARAAYTVAHEGTRRCIIIHGGGGTAALGDIRFNYNANADASDFPIIHDQYFRVDAEKGDQLDFWNTTAGAITVYVLEVK